LTGLLTETGIKPFIKLAETGNGGNGYLNFGGNGTLCSITRIYCVHFCSRDKRPLGPDP